MTSTRGPLVRPAVIALLLAVACVSARAQHTRYEFGASFAYRGQYPFIADGDANFLAKPTIWNLRAQLTTDYIQSVSAVLERVSQTTSRTGLWQASGNLTDAANAYSANITEHLAIYALYLEMIRTIVRTDIFRIGIGLDFGYALGSADATAEDITQHSSRSYQGDSPWTSFYLGLFARGRLTLYENEGMDIGLTGTLRYWGMPTLGPLTVASNNYNGPNLRAIHEVGYLAGVSIGIKKWKQQSDQ